jgi:membrane protease YdiL (CAAX protease family)
VIAARLAAPRRAALLTGLVLAAAVLRALLLPLGDAFSTAIFAACLLGITWAGGSTQVGEGVLKRRNAAIAGVAVGVLLLIPVMTGPMSRRPLGDFWSWAAIAAMVATLEETAIRGALYRSWLAESGPLAAIGIGAVVFALIHLPRYGLTAMPLDLAVGFALGGLRAVTGRVMPCAIAHTIADWGAWFWA